VGVVSVDFHTPAADLSKVDRRRAKAELKLDIRAAKAEADRAERAARDDEKRRQRTQRAEDRRQARADWAGQRAELAKTLVSTARKLRPVAPLLVVTGFAMYGQISYGLTEYSPEGWSLLPRLVVAVGAAVAVESIALYVQWHAHDALLNKASATAARLRRASYVIALGVAAVNYAHFADGWAPTPGAVVFALFSAAGPWLWGLHTRRVQNEQLTREGKLDSTGAVFSSERFRNFPLRTIGARRWSIDHGVTDPREAWEGYRAEKARRAGAPTPEQRVALLVAVTRLAVRKPVVTARPALVKAVAAAAAPRVEVKAHTTPSAPVAEEPTQPAASPRRARSTVLTDPPPVVLELVAEGHGHPELRRLSREKGIEIGEYQARELIKKYRPNNDQVATS
jgi:preprotein translocase subunit Sec61beta